MRENSICEVDTADNTLSVHGSLCGGWVRIVQVLVCVKVEWESISSWSRERGKKIF